MKRVLWFVLDSLGIGGAPDAKAYGDDGADTLGHIAKWFRDQLNRPLQLDHLTSLGLFEAYHALHGAHPPGTQPTQPIGQYAHAKEISTGKDTPSGHWEMTGVPVSWQWGYFPNHPNCFPADLLTAIHHQAGLQGSLGHCHASGTEIIKQLGEESLRSGQPIFYTSADSVFQIAAHEESFGLQKLYQLCEITRKILTPLNIGRVIARPFTGKNAETFTRTANRKDYSIPPPQTTILQKAQKAGHQTIGIGKIGDIFAHTGLSTEIKASGHPQLWEKTRLAHQGMIQENKSGILMTNFVDFDMLYGHRRDPEGYGLALEDWDKELGTFLPTLTSSDLLIITADHGNDPTWTGTDHTREQVPVLLYTKHQQPLKNQLYLGEWTSFTLIADQASNWLKRNKPLTP